MSKKESLNTEKLILKFIIIHGDIFDYSKVKFESFKSKVIIICPEHGEFTQQLRLHLRGRNGCKTYTKLGKRENKSSFILFIFTNNIICYKRTIRYTSL